MKKILVALNFLVFSMVLNAQSLTCTQGHQIALNEQCQAILSPEDFIPGFMGDASDYSVNVLNAYSQPLGNVVDGSFIGDTWVVKVEHNLTGNSCISVDVTFIDTQSPIIECTNDTIFVDCAADLNTLLKPVGIDNCDPSPQVIMVSESYVDSDICVGGEMVLVREWAAVDHGNLFSAPCQQVIVISRPEIVYPKDLVWTCTQYAEFPNITDTSFLNAAILDWDGTDNQNDIDVDPNLDESILTQTGSGQPVGFQGVYCKYNVEYSDNVYDHCGPGTFKILRKWTVIDLCEFAIDFHYQIILINDLDDPIFDFSNNNLFVNDTLVLSTDANNQSSTECTSTAYIPAPQISDNCSGLNWSTFKILTPLGQVTQLTQSGGFIPLPGLPVGEYPDGVSYQIQDSCGNIFKKKITLIIVDKIPPTMICDYITTITLVDGYAQLPAAVPTDGSFDNCALDHFEIRRETDLCGIVGNITFDNGDDNGDGWVEPGDDDLGGDDLDEGAYITFCCEDVLDSVSVTIRGYDVYGNYSDCSVKVIVKNEEVPTCTAPSNIVVDCHEFDLDLGYGSVLVNNLCGVVETNEVIDYSNFDAACNTGVIVKTWTVSDESGNSSTCSQNIEVQYSLNYTVQFPDDVINGNFDTISPFIFGNGNSCGSWGVTNVDVLSYAQDCNVRILRTWKVIDLCAYNGSLALNVVPNTNGMGPSVVANDSNHGYLEYTQILLGENPNLPEVSVMDTVVFPCNVNEVQLTGTLLTNSIITSILWTTDDGQMVSGVNNYELTVSTIGTYVIEVIDNFGCVSIDTIVVIPPQYPIANVGPLVSVTCAVPLPVIDGSGSSQGTEYEYQWETVSGNGNIVSGETTMFLKVDQAGMYSLVVTDVTTGCTAMDLIRVGIDIIEPTVEINQEDTILCDFLLGYSLTTNGSANGIQYTSEWSSSNGFSSTDANVTIFADGVYTFTVMDTYNGCSQTASVEVVIDELPPVLDCQAAIQFFCDTTQGCYADSIIIDLGITDASVLDGAQVSYYLEFDSNDDGILDSIVHSIDFDAPTIGVLEINSLSHKDSIIVQDVPYGTHQVTWEVTDKCGNTNTCSWKLNVRDCQSPKVGCENTTIVIERHPVLGTVAILEAVDLVGAISDNCTSTDVLSLGLVIYNPPIATVPTQDTLLFNCNELGAYLVAVYAVDEAGNLASCVSVVTVEDTTGFCQVAPIAGALNTPNGTGISDVAVIAAKMDNINQDTAYSSIFGMYSMEMPVGAIAYSVTPEKAGNAQNGVDVMDLMAIYDHIVGDAPFTSPAQLIAADVNEDNIVNVQDMVLMRRVVLGHRNAFAGRPIWSFYEQNCFDEMTMDAICESSFVIDSLSDLGVRIDFVGVKKGDVDQTYFPNSASVQNRYQDISFLYLQDQDYDAGDWVEVQFDLGENPNTEAFQATIEYDNSELAYVDSPLSPTNFQVGTKFLPKGGLTLSWWGQAAKEHQFTLRFKALKAGSLREVLSISSRYTIAFASVNRERNELLLDFGESKMAMPVLYQNTPNPFSEETTISYFLPEDQNVKLTVFDATGTIVLSEEKDGDFGLNQRVLKAKEIEQKGFFYYQLETGKFRFVKKMLRL